MHLLRFLFFLVAFAIADLGSANSDSSNPILKSSAFEKPLSKSHRERVEELANFLNQYPDLDVKTTIHTLVLYWQQEDYTLSEKSIAGHVWKRLNPRPNEVEGYVQAEEAEQDEESVVITGERGKANSQGNEQEALPNSVMEPDLEPEPEPELEPELEPEPETDVRGRPGPTLAERPIHKTVPEEVVSKGEGPATPPEEAPEPEPKPAKHTPEGTKTGVRRIPSSRKRTGTGKKKSSPQRTEHAYDNEEIDFLVEEARKLMLNYDDALNDNYEHGYIVAKLRERFLDISMVELQAVVTIQAYIKEQPLLVVYDQTPRVLQRRLHYIYPDLYSRDAYDLIMKTLENEKRIRWKNPPLGETAG